MATSKKQKHNLSSHKIRIIGGRWRSRQLEVIDAPGLRPTSDRVRETLFNWLAPVIEGSRCLDLFAGTGALGLEALSRGAAHCTFVEQSRPVAATLKNHIATLKADDYSQLVQTNANNFLATTNDKFDIIFLDPPFTDDVNQWCGHLDQSNCLSQNAYIYIECSKNFRSQPHDNWQLDRSGETKEVSYKLYHVS
ncbi:MAG: 16S rRNA (guanine(966)-N(2))-methyltransferase RsmD [Gammaproteobacteria bacterium]|nr:16S rRNA (guanine(966)-N(2))-methyltransferase RsmD [Gammaproteobacteria bacterium]